MGDIKAWFFVIFGVGLVLVALQGLQRGWLPTGPQGFEQGTGATRQEQPLLFWLFFLLYGGGGVALTVHALRLLAGATTTGTTG